MSVKVKTVEIISALVLSTIGRHISVYTLEFEVWTIGENRQRVNTDFGFGHEQEKHAKVDWGCLTRPLLGSWTGIKIAGPVLGIGRIYRVYALFSPIAQKRYMYVPANGRGN